MLFERRSGRMPSLEAVAKEVAVRQGFEPWVEL
jgi:hypothetical protein